MTRDPQVEAMRYLKSMEPTLASKIIHRALDFFQNEEGFAKWWMGPGMDSRWAPIRAALVSGAQREIDKFAEHLVQNHPSNSTPRPQCPQETDPAK